MPTVTTSDGVTLHLVDEGAGPPVLFLHEFLGDHRSWDTQVADLRFDHRCLTFPARGYPPSQVPAQADHYSWELAVRDALDVLDHAGVDRAHIVGLSMGGFTALQLGARHSHRVRSLLVASTGSGAYPPTRETFLTETQLIAELFRTEGSAAVADRLAVGPSRVQLQRKSPERWQEFRDQLAGHSAEGSAFTVLQVQRARPSLFDITDDLARITAPTLVANGDEDAACLDAGLLLKRTVTTAALRVEPSTGHALNLEDPTRFNAVVREFVATVEAGRWPERDSRSAAGGTGVRPFPTRT
ncbi:alpha/beta fold hydrolase [Streptomyces sp. NPDC101225]|uniref:alpha/beta fold hydrolase n=1 Tax=Streptomyces sp. NPDC101225 TaxID=3366135 RepID=UPI0038051010